MKKPEVRIENRKARYDYEFIDSYVAGLVLTGAEVKAIRDGKVTLADSFCWFVQDELWTNKMVINVEGANQHIKLLLNRKELNKLYKNLLPGMTIVISKLFSVKGKIKADISLAKGKKNYDKRETIKARDIDRDTKRSVG
jgi:SsrA-binding protein